MESSDINWLHVEASSRCNAWCPACPRNKSGYGLADGLVETDLTVDQFKSVLTTLPNLTSIQFCGNHGDPIISKNILELIGVAIDYSKQIQIQIHTNGSLRSKSWWANLANMLSKVKHEVWFGLDGLLGVHEIYRQGTSFNKVIENATSFIDNGGYAVWQFIPYGHNEHQTKDCHRMSQKLGFKKFQLAKLHRRNTVAKHFQTGNEFILEAPKQFQDIIRVVKDYKTVDVKNCMHFSYPSVYLSAQGKLSTCCYQSKNNVDNVNDLLYTMQDLSNRICLYSCGS